MITLSIAFLIIATGFLVWDVFEDRQEARAAAMRRHPAGKGRDQ